MRKSGMFVLLLIAFLCANAWAKDEVNGKDIAASLKQAGDAVGTGMGAAGKAIAPEVSKAESWLDGAIKSGGKKSDKACK
jgi:hypothetical protein